MNDSASSAEKINTYHNRRKELYKTVEGRICDSGKEIYI